MFKTYIQVALRNLSKDKFYSIINILGLTVGLISFLLIYLFVQHELSYDTYYPNSENIYRVASRGAFGGSEFDIAVASAPTGQAMQNDYPEVQDFIRFRTTGPTLFKSDENYYEETPVFADGNFFDFFSQQIIAGNPVTALLKPNTVAISQALAERVFGGKDPIGKIFEFNSDFNSDVANYEVTAVYQDIPDNTHFRFDLIVSMESLEESRDPIWLNQNFQTYIQFSPGTDVSEFGRKMQGMVRKYMGPELQKFLGKSIEEFEQDGNSIALYLQPVKDIHLKSNLVAEIEGNGDLKYVYIFSAIAVFILLIASINYMNLATARSSDRAKEVGLRKVMGAYKSQLMLQFIAESIIMALIAVILAILGSYWSLPFFNELSGKNFDGSVFESPSMVGLILVVAILIGLVSGSYPAFFLSAFKPADVLKGKISSGSKNGRLRNILVVFQFSISMFLIVGTMAIFNQLAFVQNSDLGFEKEHKIILKNTSSLGKTISSFKEEVLANSQFESGTITSFLPSPSSRNQSAVFKGSDPNDGTTSMQIWTVDHDFIKTMGMELAEGRDFSKDFSTDSTTVIINQAAAVRMGFESALSERIGFYTNRSDDGQTYDVTSFNVIGVVEDFNYNSLRENIEPLILRLGDSPRFIMFKTSSNNYPLALELLEAKWNEFAPGYPFEYSFLDDKLNEVYAGDVQIGKILGTFASIAIFIACLGLFALSSFTAEQRSKEIGIRKVLGASVVGIMTLLSKEFIKLMAIAFALATPLSYLVMNKWLEEFVYRTTVEYSTFIIAGSGLFLIAWITISYQSLKAAQTNPVNTLGDE